MYEGNKSIHTHKSYNPIGVNMAQQEYQAIVVGSGAAGSFVVNELAKRGVNVLLLEAGRNITENDFPVDSKGPKEKGIQLWARAMATLTGQHIQSKVALYAKQQRHLFVNDWEHPYSAPKDAPYLWIRGKQLGGRLHTFGRMLLRWSDYDFKASNRDGHGINWPISYSELEPYYEQVEKILGIYGRTEHIPNLPDSIYVGKSWLNFSEEQFKSTIEHQWTGRKVTSWRYMSPNAKRIPMPILNGISTGNLTICTDAVVTTVRTDQKTGLALGVTYIDRLTGKEITVDAKVVVVCASPIETVRLLLNSTSKRHPKGLGNSTDNLGRYFMDQVPNMIMGTIPSKYGFEVDKTLTPDPFYGTSGGIYIPRYENIEKINIKFKRGFAFQGTVGRLFTTQDKPSRFAVMGFGEMLPNRENTITLNRSRSDKWGVPIPHITCRMSDNEKSMLAEQMSSIQDMVKAAGLNTEFNTSYIRYDEYGKGAFPEENILSKLLFKMNIKNSMTMGAAIHESGGARMGDHPGNSVLNSNNQCWDAENVFVTDASCFTTGGCTGTTLTVMAINARAGKFIAEYIQKQ